MSEELNTLWNDFKMHCESVFAESDKLTANSAKLYLDGCLPVSFEDGVLLLDVPTPFAKEQIKSRFLPKMVDIFKDVGFGNDIKVEVSQEVSAEEEKRAEVAVTTQRVTQPSRNGLNPNYVFSSFVVGKSNRLAHAASLAVAESPGIAYNPLFIWGKVGLGKTHLMHAIGHYIEEISPSTNVLYVTAEKFTNDLISSIKNSSNADFRARNRDTNSEFRSKYRQLDVLMVDDIQFIAEKETTQEEFFHTFNELHNAKKQVIISSDRPPKEIHGIEDRLVSRFEWGLVTDIQPPDLETRVAILQKKAELKNYSIPEDIILFIAQNIPSNIRELEGALNRIVACSEFNSEPMTIENALDWLKDMMKDNKSGAASVGFIQQQVADTFGVSLEDMLSKKRTADIALARQVAMYFVRNKTGESLQQISHAFNKKDHTTVIHACKKVENLIKTDIRLKSFVDIIEGKL